MGTEYLIGIDPGVSSGLSVYKLSTKEFIRAKTTDFWGVVEELEHFSPKETIIIIEWSQAISPTFARKGANQFMMAKIARNVGGNHREGYLLAKRFRNLGFEVLESPPKKEDKWDAKETKEITGYHGSTNEHLRDSLRLIWQYLQENPQC